MTAAAAAVVRVVAMVVVALSVAARAATVAVVEVAGMDAAGVAAATLSSREVGLGEAGLAVVLAAASCGSGAEALRCCCVAVMVGLVLEVASLRWTALMHLNAASGQKQLPREGRRQATSLRRRPVLLSCVEAVAEALLPQCVGLCAGHCDQGICAATGNSVFATRRSRARRKNIVVPTMIDASEVVNRRPRQFRRRNVLAPMLERFRASGRGTVSMVAARHRQGPVASAGCSQIQSHNAFVQAVR